MDRPVVGRPSVWISHVIGEEDQTAARGEKMEAKRLVQQHSAASTVFRVKPFGISRINEVGGSRGRRMEGLLARLFETFDGRSGVAVAVNCGGTVDHQVAAIAADFSWTLGPEAADPA